MLFRSYKMKRKIYIISDTHFNHDKIIELEKRDKNYKNIIMKKWNKNVNDDDIIIHLGDVIFSNASELSEIDRKSVV